MKNPQAGIFAHALTGAYYFVPSIESLLQVSNHGADDGTVV